MVSVFELIHKFKWGVLDYSHKSQSKTRIFVHISKEFKVAALFIISSICLYFGFTFLKGINFFSSSSTYYVLYKNIDGLTVSNQVMINGLAVGRVSHIDLLQEKNNELLVTIEVNNEITLGNQTVALLVDDGFLGGKIIELMVHSDGSSLIGGDTLASQIDEGITALFEEKAEHVIKNLDSTMYNVNKLLVEYQGSSEDVKKLLTNATQTLSSVNKLILSNQSNLVGITKNFKDLSSSLVETEKSLKPILSKMNNFADSLQSVPIAEAGRNASQLMKELNKTAVAINQAEGSLGMLIKNDSLYRNLNEMILSIETLTTEFNDDPHRFLAPLGKKKKGKDNKKLKIKSR
jgi:phospholipid/cholesterol/gamma-HCH transport system substrate-binding protein